MPHKTGWPWDAASDANLGTEKDFPKISIITPSYNQGQYIEETIRSIVLQNYPNYELIIIDAGSTDNTLEVIKKYEPWITYWVSEKDRGQSHAIRKGLAVATGDIINWINSDDICAPGAFHHIANELTLDTKDVVCGYCDYFLGGLDNLDLRNMRMGISATVGDTILSHKINQPSTFFKASVIKSLDIDEQFHYAMDLDMWYRYLLIAGQDRVVLSDKLLTYFRLHDTSKSVSESARFEGDIRKVFYNIVYSTNGSPALLAFMSRSIPEFAAFTPTRYPVQIPEAELKPFMRFLAWRAVNFYNEAGDLAAAKECLRIARQSGQPLDATLIRQLIKHYAMPKVLLRWLARS
ncbi:glycosyltransferase family 2 protein [Hymenobacter sp. BT491]|uniref:glycosyltransferase family 2 protein n=1 Tax=Hymenobacter sp. BT491 TaxID=2766779 RepID=UPI001CA3B8E3|nr:glycosyltransferase family 2 protein [Hymenobacter sp. BT491]